MNQPKIVNSSPKKAVTSYGIAICMITTISSQKLGVPILIQRNVCIQNLPEGPPEGPLKGKAGN